MKTLEASGPILEAKDEKQPIATEQNISVYTVACLVLYNFIFI